jgi:hypothetical protein
MEIASLPAIAGGFPPEAPEPISPELVLIDPELRRALQARPLERPPLQLVRDAPPALSAPSRESEPPPPSPLPLSLALQLAAAPPRPARRADRWARRRLVPILLPLSLALNAALIASAVSDSTASQPAATPPPVTTAVPKPSGSAAARQPVRRTAGRKTAAGRPAASRVSPRGARNAQAESRILRLLVASPAGKLPPALIDSNTGLAKNNLQAVCRLDGGPGSFRCLVRPQRHKAGEGLYVRYRTTAGGRARITWSRYRSG